MYWEKKMQKKWCWMMCVKYVCKNSCMWTWFGFVPFLLCFDCLTDWLCGCRKWSLSLQKWLVRALFLHRVLLFFQKSLFQFFIVIVNITECVEISGGKKTGYIGEYDMKPQKCSLKLSTEYVEMVKDLDASENTNARNIKWNWAKWQLS